MSDRNNEQINLRINVGTDKALANQTILLLEALGYKIPTNFLANLRSISVSWKLPVSICVTGGEIAYSTQDYFDREKTGRYGSLPVLGLPRKEPVKVKVGDYEATVDKEKQTIEVNGIVIPAATVRQIAEVLHAK